MMQNKSVIVPMAGGSPLETSGRSVVAMLAAAHRYVTGLRNSGIARTSLVNAVYGIGDYIAQL